MLRAEFGHYQFPTAPSRHGPCRFAIEGTTKQASPVPFGSRSKRRRLRCIGLAQSPLPARKDRPYFCSFFEAPVPSSGESRPRLGGDRSRLRRGASRAPTAYREERRGPRHASCIAIREVRTSRTLTWPAFSSGSRKRALYRIEDSVQALRSLCFDSLSLLRDLGPGEMLNCLNEPATFLSAPSRGLPLSKKVAAFGRVWIAVFGGCAGCPPRFPERPVLAAFQRCSNKRL